MSARLASTTGKETTAKRGSTQYLFSHIVQVVVIFMGKLWMMRKESENMCQCHTKKSTPHYLYNYL